MSTLEAADENAELARSSGENLVSIADVAKRYGPRVAVEQLTLSLRAGEVFGLVGANGGGKTTTLRMLAGILKPDQGHGHVLGFDFVNEAGEIRRHVGYMSQRLSLYADLSVFENLRFRAEIYGLDKPRIAADRAIEDFGLMAYRRSAAKRLSGGWARRLQLAAALIHHPRLLLLDEPTAGLDAVSRQEVWQRIGYLAAHGAGIVVSTHDLAEAERCAQAAFLVEGRVVAIGTPDQVAQSAPAAVFLLSGIDTRLLADQIDALPGVIASYPQGESLRIVAGAEAEAVLQRAAKAHRASLKRATIRLEDAALVFSQARSRSQV